MARTLAWPPPIGHRPERRNPKAAFRQGPADRVRARSPAGKARRRRWVVPCSSGRAEPGAACPSAVGGVSSASGASRWSRYPGAEDITGWCHRVRSRSATRRRRRPGDVRSTCGPGEGGSHCPGRNPVQVYGCGPSQLHSQPGNHDGESPANNDLKRPSRDPSLSVERSVFGRRAPASVGAIERTPGTGTGPGNTAANVRPESLGALTAATRR